jgi:hypothetical protein
MIQDWIGLHGLDADALVSTRVRVDLCSAEPSVRFWVDPPKMTSGLEAVDERR